MARPRTGAGSVLERGVGLVALLALAAWVAAAVVMARRGLDLTDESFYLLSYRWWDSNPRTFTGAQYLYGPVFELMGYDVPGLRLVRLVTLLLAHAVLAEAVCRYLRAAGRPSWSHGGAARLLLVSLGGISYGWLPQSPGYNDVALLVGLVLVAAAVVTATRALAEPRAPVLVLTVSGWCLGALVLAKWSAALAIGVLFVAAVVTLLRRSWAAVVVALAATAAGGLVWVLTVRLAIGPWGEILRPMREVNALVTAETNSPVTLVVMYLQTTGRLLLASLLLAAVAVLPLALSPARSRVPVVVGSLPLAGALPWLATRELPSGGPEHAWTYSLSLTSMTIAALLLTGVLRRPSVPVPSADQPGPSPGAPRSQDGVVLAVLVIAPAAQAFGTGNALYLLAVSGFAFWGALVLVLLSREDGLRPRAVALGFLASCSVLVALVASTALLVNPYRSDGLAEATAPVTRAGTLEGLLLAPDLRDDLAALAQQVDDASPGDSAVYAVDELAGIVLALDRPPAGEAWTSRLDNARAAAGLRAWCEDRPDTPPPVVVAGRTLSALDREALRRCGWPFYPDFRALSTHDGPEDLRVYVPRAR